MLHSYSYECAKPTMAMAPLGAASIRGFGMKRLLLSLFLLVAFVPLASADVMTGAQAFRSGDYTTALREFRALAEKGDSNAQHALGLMYAEGAGVPRDWTIAAEWYRKAAEQGHPQSQHNLAVAYLTGIGVPRDGAQAAKWYRKAAEQGDARAQYNLGRMYAEGRGVDQDYGLAAAWYRDAAEAGNLVAQIKLAHSYRTGRGVPKDRAKASELYRKVFENLRAKESLNLWLVDHVDEPVPYYPGIVTTPVPPRTRPWSKPAGATAENRRQVVRTYR